MAIRCFGLTRQKNKRMRPSPRICRTAWSKHMFFRQTSAIVSITDGILISNKMG